MKNVIFLCSCLLLMACEAPNSTKGESVVAESTVENTLEEQTSYEADSTIKVVCQIDKQTKARHGAYKEYDNTTQVLLVESTYEQNKIVGTETYYTSDGNIYRVLTYKDGIHHGPFKYYYPNGQIKQSGTFVNGQIEGVLRGFYLDGTLREEVTHQEGVTQGPFKEYNENGTIKVEGSFTSKGEEEDLDHGLIKMYDENGVLNTKMVCKDGTCCTIWTLKKGDIKPKNRLCRAIVKEFEEEAKVTEEKKVESI